MSIFLGLLSLFVGPLRSAHFNAMKCKPTWLLWVIVGRGGYAFFAHVDLGFFVATSSKGDVLMGSSIHCAHGDVLLAFALFLHRIKEGRFNPSRNCFVRIGDFSAKIKCPKGG